MPEYPAYYIEMTRRSHPDCLRWYSDKLLDAAGRYAISEIETIARALVILADEIAQSDGPGTPNEGGGSVGS